MEEELGEIFRSYIRWMGRETLRRIRSNVTVDLIYLYTKSCARSVTWRKSQRMSRDRRDYNKLLIN